MCSVIESKGMIFFLYTVLAASITSKKKKKIEVKKNKLKNGKHFSLQRDLNFLCKT